MTHSLYNHLIMPKATGDLVKSFSGHKVPQHDFLGGLLPCYGLYKTADNRYMAVGALKFKFWQLLCESLALVEYADAHWQRGFMPNTVESRAVTYAMTDTFASHPLEYCQKLFANVDACVTPVLTLEEAKTHSLFAHQDQHHATSG